jgi:hypothetical protein
MRKFNTFCSALILLVCYFVLPSTAKAQVLNNGKLRIGNGSEASVFNTGNLRQPHYFNASANAWRQLTFSVRTLEHAFGVGGDKASEWNLNGQILYSPALSSQVINSSNYIPTSASTGYGTIISTGTVIINGQLLEVTNTYFLPQNSAYIKATVKLRNISSGLMENVRMWVGTGDDWVGQTDGPTKTKGNLINGAFAAIQNPSTRASAIQITSGSEGVLFYTNSTRGNTGINWCCSFSNVVNQNPQGSAITLTGDGSYGFFVRMNDLPVGASDEFTWYYAAGQLADLDDIIGEVAAVSGAMQNITYTTADFKATATVNSTGYWMVVPQNAPAPTAAQIKAGANYGSVVVAQSGSGAMTTNVERTFNLTGLTPGANYDLYFVSQNSSQAFSSIIRVPFATLAYAAPTVSTTALSGITFAGAVSGGTVSADGGTGVTARGVVWNTTGTPTIADNSTTDGTGTGAFSSSLIGLQPNTTYYVRAYATNSVATAYGSQLSFTTPPADPTSITPSANPVCQGSSVLLTANGAQGTVHWYTGSCGGTLIGTGNTITVTPVASTTYYARNHNGSFSSGCASVAVTVGPNLPPTPNVATLPTITDECSASVTAPTATDNCGNTVVGTTVDPTSYTQQGTYTINWTYTDGRGNSSTQTQSVVIRDVTPPVITCPAPIEVNSDENSCRANVTVPTAGHTNSCLSGWNSAMPIQINSANSSALTDHQVRIVLNTQQLISEGSMKADAGDMRFTGTDCSTLSYWIESGVNTAQTIVWVKIPQIPANSSTTIFLNYGNANAVSASNGTSTFILFDDFEDGNAGGWTFGSGTWSIANTGGNQRLHATNSGFGNGAAAILASSLTVDEYIVETDYYPIDGGSHGGPTFEFNDFSNYYAVHSMANSAMIMHSRIQNGGADYGLSWYYPHNNGQWFNFRVERSTINNSIYFNNAFITSVPRVFSEGAGLWNYGEQSYFDNFRVRKYASLTPTVIVGATTPGFNVSDNCSIASITNSFNNSNNASGFYPVGTTTVTWTATDAAGNTSTCQQTVTVVDAQKPTVVTQNITVQLDATGQAVITAAQINNNSTDNCSIPADGYSLSKSSFDCSNVGDNTVTLTVTDINGNSESTTAVVTVEDNVKPTVVTQNITVQLDATGQAVITAAEVNNGSSDPCGIASMSLDKTSFDCSNVGTPVSVLLTVTDVNGNVNTATAIVTVKDEVKPSVVAQNITVQLDANGNASITAAQIDNGSSDACGIASFSLSKSTFDCSNVGSNQVTLTVTDIHNNVNTATATVTVEDKIAPVVVTKPVTVQLDAQGHATISEDAVNNASTDACGGLTFDTDITSFDCSNVGTPVSVTLTVTDANGNSATGTALVTVEDKVKPTVRTKAATVTLQNGTATLTADMVNDGSSDACGIKSKTLDRYSFDCKAIGQHEVTLTVVDNNGNEASAKATVTVVGVIPSPAITVSRTNTTYTGPGNEKTIFLGYGAQSLNLVASDASAPASAIYAWSPSGFLSTASGAATTYNPNDSQTGDNTITVTATNQYGCTASTPVTITVVDARCGSDLTKVNMCHVAGNDATHVKTICIDGGSVHDHLAKGCKIGACPETGTVASGVEAEVIAHSFALKTAPNPSTAYFTLKVETNNLADRVMLRVMDVKGRLVETKQNVQPNQTLRIGDNYRPGIYFVEVVQGAERTQAKLIKLSN